MPRWKFWVTPPPRVPTDAGAEARELLAEVKAAESEVRALVEEVHDRADAFTQAFGNALGRRD